MKDQIIVGWEYKNGKKHLPIVFNVWDYIDYNKRSDVDTALLTLQSWDATDDKTVYHCRVCGRTMGEPNKGWDYRCYDCSDEED